jgi:hypothetical protein
LSERWSVGGSGETKLLAEDQELKEKVALSPFFDNVN